MPSSISSQKTPKYKKLSRKRKTAQNLSILSCFMMECRWWDSNPHGFPNDFESFASAIPPHRLIFNFGTFVPVFEDWRDVRNPTLTNLQNSTHPREFLVQTWKITERILSRLRLPFRHIREQTYYTGFGLQNQVRISAAGSGKIHSAFCAAPAAKTTHSAEHDPKTKVPA